MSEDTVPYHQLWRSRTERKIAGICGGLGEYFRVDPFWMRLLFVLFFLAGGTAFLVYVIMWIMIPLKPIQTKTRKKKDIRPVKS